MIIRDLRIVQFDQVEPLVSAVHVEIVGDLDVSSVESRWKPLHDEEAMEHTLFIIATFPMAHLCSSQRLCPCQRGLNVPLECEVTKIPEELYGKTPSRRILE